jgi:serine/threonine protein phosphatase PrpC
VAYAYTDEALLLVLADGMGGHLHGEVAAQIAIHAYMRAFAQVALPKISNPQAFLSEVMREAHEEIIRYAHEQKLSGNPGTTCVAAVVQDKQVCWAYAGDSRFYLLRNKDVIEVTHDHSVVQQWADWGIISLEEMRIHPDRNKITNCLGGIEDMFYVEQSPLMPIQSNDVLLLCSDGLWGPLQNQEIATSFASGNLPDTVDKLIDTALSREGASADNATVVVARWGEDEPENKTDLASCIVLDYR